MQEIKRGDIVMAELQGEYSVQGGYRPVIIVQNDKGNKFSPTTIIVPLTSKMNKTNLPTHEIISTRDASGLSVDSVALCEQIITIDKRKIVKLVGKIKNDFVMKNISRACCISLNLI